MATKIPRWYRLTRTGQSQKRHSGDGFEAKGRLYEYTIDSIVGGALHYFVGHGWGQNKAAAYDDWRRRLTRNA